MKYSRWTGELSIKCKSQFKYKYDIKFMDKNQVRQQLIDRQRAETMGKIRMLFWESASYSDTESVTLLVSENNEYLCFETEYSYSTVNENIITCYAINEPKITFEQLKDFLYSFFVDKKEWVCNLSTNSKEVVFVNPKSKRPYVKTQKEKEAAKEADRLYREWLEKNQISTTAYDLCAMMESKSGQEEILQNMGHYGADLDPLGFRISKKSKEKRTNDN